MKTFEIERHRDGRLEDYYSIQCENVEEACRIIHKNVKLQGKQKKVESDDIKEIVLNLEELGFSIEEIKEE